MVKKKEPLNNNGIDVGIILRVIIERVALGIMVKYKKPSAREGRREAGPVRTRARERGAGRTGGRRERVQRG